MKLSKKTTHSENYSLSLYFPIFALLLTKQESLNSPIFSNIVVFGDSTSTPHPCTVQEISFHFVAILVGINSKNEK